MYKRVSKFVIKKGCQFMTSPNNTFQQLLSRLFIVVQHDFIIRAL